ncbi:MAG: enoyl-CoA hydratase-related protein, partial [Tepidiformaceae bacterium]
MPDPQVRYEQEGRVAKLVLNRPEVRNAQSRILIEELDAAYARATADDSVGAIVLMGEGDNFSAGHDLGTAEELADREVRPIGAGIRGRYRRSWDMNIEPTMRWRNIPKPTVCAVQGYCIFAGWIISSASDVIFAADDALFLPTNFQYFSVPWDLHPRHAKAILFESRFIGAYEAQELGFVWQVVSREKLQEEAVAY